MLMTKLNINSRINEFTKEDILRSKVLEGLGIDACCGGNKSLAIACAEKGLDPEAVFKKLVSVNEQEDVANEQENWSEVSLTDLVKHIEETHHDYLKKVLPHLSSLVEKVVSAHGKRHPELLELQQAFTHLREDLEPHLMKEERVLFPMVRQMESGVALEEFQCGLQGPIRVMQEEHKRADSLQGEIRKITNNFSFPEDGCGTYRLMLEELKNLDTDLNIHIQKENEILFPGILNAEKYLV